MAKEMVPWYRRPICLGLVGLALMVGGWKLSTWVPESGSVARLRGLAGEDAELRDKLDQYARRGAPPHQLPGRLLLLAGAVLFVASGVQMYRQQPERAEEAGEQAQAG